MPSTRRRLSTDRCSSGATPATTAGARPDGRPATTSSRQSASWWGGRFSRYQRSLPLPADPAAGSSEVVSGSTAPKISASRRRRARARSSASPASPAPRSDSATSPLSPTRRAVPPGHRRSSPPTPHTPRGTAVSLRKHPAAGGTLAPPAAPPSAMADVAPRSTIRTSVLPGRGAAPARTRRRRALRGLSYRDRSGTMGDAGRTWQRVGVHRPLRATFRAGGQHRCPQHHSILRCAIPGGDR